MARSDSTSGSGSSPTGRGEPDRTDPRIVDREVTDVRPGHLDEPVHRDPVRHDTAQRSSVDVALPGPRGDQIRWGAVWAGLVVALATFLLLEVAFFALGWLTLDPGPDEGSTAGWVTGLIGLFAFFLGGLTAGATAMWHGLRTGLLHGIVVWALGVVSILGLALAGGSSLLGSFGDVANQVINLRDLAGDVSDADVQSAVDSARDASSWAILGLGLAVVAAALGGLLGAKMWSGHEADHDAGHVHTN